MLNRKWRWAIEPADHTAAAPAAVIVLSVLSASLGRDMSAILAPHALQNVSRNHAREVFHCAVKLPMVSLPIVHNGVTVYCESDFP